MKKMLLTGLLVTFALMGCGPSATEQAPTATQVPSEKPVPAATTPPPAKTAPSKTPAAKTTPVPKTTTINASTAVSAKITITMDAGNFYFKPNALTVKVNQPVTVNFTNSGFHTFVIDELGVKVKLEGATGSGSFTPTKAGTFQFYCDVGSHKSMGMFGTLTVTE